MGGRHVVLCSAPQLLYKFCIIEQAMNFSKNKMQLEKADFAAGAAAWRTVRNMRVVFVSGIPCII